MQKLSIKDKQDIFGFIDITEDSVIGEKRKVIVFEYLSNFTEKFLFDIILEKGIEFQLKIKKEKYIESYIENSFINIKKLLERKNNIYNILINTGAELDEIKISSEDILPFISIEKGSKYLYKHYLIINIDETVNLNQLIFDFVSSIKNDTLIMRKLKTKDLEQYIFNEINFPYSYGDDIRNFDEAEKKEEMEYDLAGLSIVMEKVADGILKGIEGAFFNDKFHLTNETGYLLSQNTWKGDNYIRIGDNYKGGLFLKGIPRADFNILHFLGIYLESGDSITINFYKDKKHQDIKEDKKGVAAIFEEKKEIMIENNDFSYIQVIINFNDVSPEVLSNRINKYQLSIQRDFFTQRIDNIMSRYIGTILGTGINLLNLEKRYETKFLSNKFNF